jgi:acetyltransferase-like isoleucine patch superfamily enzyme
MAISPDLRLLAPVIRRAAKSVAARYLIASDPISYARHIGVRVGQDCRLLGTDRETFGGEPYLVSIGDHVTVTAGVRFITHDGGVWVLRQKYPDIDVVGRIQLHDNVFVGVGAILLPNVEIGPNSIVAAGAVVSRTVPPGIVAAGVPARPICTLAEYEAKVLPRATHVRSLPAEQKTRLFQLHTLGPNK